MSNPIIRRFPDPEQLSRAAAEEFIRRAKVAGAARGRFTVALAGGSTPRRLYELLAETPYREQVEWPQVEFFWGDERSVAPDHADSNFRMASETLLRRVEVPLDHVHRMEADREDRAAAAREYQEEIAGVLGMLPGGEPP